MARHLESLGPEVIVADPNDAPMYAKRSRRTTTETRDARTLMDACETGAWRPAYRLSEGRRHVRAELAVRDALVRTRTRDIALAKALVRRDGLRVPTRRRAWVPTRIAALDLSPALTTELAPLFAVFAPLNAQIAVADARIAAFVHEDPIAARLTTAPGVGPVPASAFVATIEDLTRFRLGPITTAGNGRLQWRLVEAAWTILRSTSAETAALRAWTLQVAQRRGKRIAVVARARREPRRTDARIEMTEEGPCSGRKSSRSIGKPTRTSQPLGTHAFARGPGSSYVRGQVTPTSP